PIATAKNAHAAAGNAQRFIMAQLLRSVLCGRRTAGSDAQRSHGAAAVPPAHRGKIIGPLARRQSRSCTLANVPQRKSYHPCGLGPATRQRATERPLGLCAFWGSQAACVLALRCKVTNRSYPERSRHTNRDASSGSNCVPPQRAISASTFSRGM